MKRAKRVISILLTLVLLLGVVPGSVFAEKVTNVNRMFILERNYEAFYPEFGFPDDITVYRAIIGHENAYLAVSGSCGILQEGAVYRGGCTYMGNAYPDDLPLFYAEDILVENSLCGVNLNFMGDNEVWLQAFTDADKISDDRFPVANNVFLAAVYESDMQNCIVLEDSSAIDFLSSLPDYTSASNPYIAVWVSRDADGYVHEIFLKLREVPDEKPKDPPATEHITLEWAQKGWLDKRNDTSKPPIPNGTDAEYAEALRAWAQKNGISSIHMGNAEQLLDYPMYFPVTDRNGNIVLLNDGASTIRQVIEDIVFLEYLHRDYVVGTLDRDISEVENFNFTNIFTGIYGMKQERKIYETVLDWYGQIGKYLERRNGNSNLFLSSSGALANVLLMNLVTSAGGDTYNSYIHPYVKANLSVVEDRTGMNSLSGYTKYQDYKDKVDEFGFAAKTGKTLYKAIVEGEGGIVSLNAELLKFGFGQSDNETLNTISDVWEKYDDSYSAVKVSMFLGSSLGMFPLVIDLYNSMFKNATNQVKAMYLLADYYIFDKYPNVYSLLFRDGTGYPVKFDYLYVAENPELDYSQYITTDPILYNWLYNWKKGAEEKWRDDCAAMRRDLVNYALLLKFAQEFDAAEAKQALVRYLDAELHTRDTTGISVKCPVRVNVYDQSDRLVASLSSQDETIPEIPNGTAYLLGENNEEKHILLDADQYRVEILPYDSGTMDVQITNTANGTASTVYYGDVAIAGGMVIETETADLAPELSVDDSANGNGTYSVPPSETIPAERIQLLGAERMEAGTERQLEAVISPMGADSTGLVWSSSAPEVLAAASDGTVTARMPGKAVLTVTEPVSGVSASMEITVVQPITELVPTQEVIELKTGETAQVSVQVLPDNADRTALRWHTNAANVASVDETGTIHTDRVGEAVLTAYAGNVKSEILVKVLPNGKDLEGQAELLRLGEESTILELTNAYTGSCVVALYDRSGKMLTAGAAKAEAQAGKMEISYKKIALEDICKVKILLLDANGAPVGEPILETIKE